MLNFTSLAKNLRVLLGRHTSEPDVAVLSLARVTADGFVDTPPLVTASAPLTGASLTFNTTGSDELLSAVPAGTIAALTITFPTDALSRIGQKIGIVSTQIVTALTVSSSGLTLKGTAITALVADAPIYWEKVRASTWQRTNVSDSATQAALASGTDLTALAGNIDFTKEAAHTLNINASTTSNTAGGALTIAAGAAAATNAAGGAAVYKAGAGAGTGAGGAVSLVGGASGAGATGKGGAVNVTGGAATSTNDDGGSVIISGGAKAGTGINGLIRLSGVTVFNLTPTTITDTATLTVAQLKSGTIKATPTAAASYTMPTGAVLQAALPASLAVGDSFDFSIVNVATNASFDATLVTAASGITLYGNLTIASNDAVGTVSFATFRIVATDVTGGAATFDVYRVG